MQHDASPASDAPDNGARALHERPRIVVAGEFGTGKSSVINAMLRRPFLPFDIGATNRPLISLYHARDTGIVVTPWSGAPFEVATFDAIPDMGDVQGLAIRTPMPHLEGVEIVELPFHHDGVVEDGVIEVMATADLLVWVTIASQAWRLTEKAVVERLPPECRARSVLALSRADKLRSAADRAKIEARIRRECGALFSEVVFMQAGSSLLGDCASSDAHWIKSGGRALVAKAHGAIGTAARKKRPLPDHVRAEPLAPPPPPPKAAGSVIPFLRQPAPAEAPAPDLPVFLRSTRSTPTPRPAEASSQHVRDAVAAGRGHRPADEVAAEIEEHLAQATGLDAAGIGNFRRMQVIRSFRSARDISVDANVLASAICLNSAVSASECVAPEDDVEEVTIRAGNRVFLIVPIDLRAGTFAFFAVQANRANPATMRMLLRRVVALWREVRTP